MKKNTKKIISSFLFAGLLCTSINVLSFSANAASKPIIHNFGLHDPDGANRYGWMSDVYQFYTNLASTKGTVTNHNYFTSSTLLSSFSNANYFTIHTHGIISSSDSSYFALKCIDSSGNKTSLNKDALNVYSSNAFSNLKVAYIAACESANSNHNFASILKNHGAKSTIGYAKSVNTSCNYNTIGAFHLVFCNGNTTVSSAMSNAIKGTYNKYGKYGNVDSYKIYGSSSIKYN